MNLEQPRPDTSSNPTALNRSVGFLGILGQSIAGESPTATPTLNVAIVFGAAGSASWLVFLIATLGILLLAANIIPFARSMASSGSLSDYVAAGLGESWRIVAGWALLLAYLSSCVAVLCAGAGFSESVLSACGIKAQLAPLVVIEGAVCALLALRNVRLSTGMMLGLEIVSVILVLLLCLAVLHLQGLAVDLSQLHINGITTGGVTSGLLIALLSFSGFEEAAALGDEARDPHRTIPRVLLTTPIISGIFFVFTAYVLVLGFNRYGVNAASSQAPLADLARGIHRPDLGVLIDLGAAISLFGCTLAGMVATSRIAFSLASRGALPAALSAVRQGSFIPGNAALSAILTILPVAIGFALFSKSLDIYNWFGTFAIFGFLTVYGLACAAAPFFLRRTGSLRAGHIAVSLAGLGVLVFVFVSSVYPPQPAPMGLIPWIFLIFGIAGTGFSVWSMRSK